MSSKVIVEYNLWRCSLNDAQKTALQTQLHPSHHLPPELSPGFCRCSPATYSNTPSLVYGFMTTAMPIVLLILETMK
jgi:hypothetical protein